uniref:ATP-grasp domain-containing protein n=1 Tax=Gadus morhua TaxID=8049 RepID=A0A8C5FK20_GADMO
PRKVTYFLSCDPYSNEEVTRVADCPIASSGPLGRFWGDVLTSRVLLKKASLNTPPTLALLNPSADTPLEEGVVGAVELNSVLCLPIMKVVLRRSGGRFVDWAASSKPVYLSLDITEEVWAYVVKLLPGLLPGEAALLEGFCPPLKPQATLEVRGPPPIPDLSFRLCAVVNRSPQDIHLIYKLVCRVGASDSPLSHHQSLCQSLETTLRACGFTDPMFAVSLRHLATKTALDCVRGVNAQTDMIGAPCHGDPNHFASKMLHPDGYVCFWDDCVILTSQICDTLRLRGPLPGAVSIAKEKSRTHLHLLSLTKAAGVLTASVEEPGMNGSEEETLRALAEFGARDFLTADHPGIGLGLGNAMTLMEYVDGTEHDVDVVIFNGPTRPPTFTETTAQMPSGLAPDKRGQLIRAAYHACLRCGLRDGVYNVELKIPELGPRLIEMNARMGGFYLRNWILQLYGVDLVLAAFMVACGVRPLLPSASDLPAGGHHFAGVMCVVSQHLQALRTTSSLTYLRSLHQEGANCFNELAAADELIAGQFEEPFCNVAMRDTCAERARQHMLVLCQAMGLNRPPHYDLTFFLSEFS